MKTKETKIIVFSDLDGSLLNNKYEYFQIESIIHHLLSLKVAIVFASSKTRSEVEFYRNQMQITDPFIVENGCAIIIPKHYFRFKYEFSKSISIYNIIQLGIDYFTIREKLDSIKKRTGIHILGFGDMTVEEIAKDSGLPLRLAHFAKKRGFSEPLKIPTEKRNEVLEALRDEGICHIWGGKYLSALGNCDKGKATSILRNLYLKEFEEVFTIGVGNGANDLNMLKVVDKSFFVNTVADIENTWREIESIAITR